jgi:hypothetical protein
MGITHIVNVACLQVNTGKIFYMQQGHRFTVLTLDLNDTSTFNITPFFEEVNRFIEVALHCGGKMRRAKKYFFSNSLNFSYYRKNSHTWG